MNNNQARHYHVYLVGGAVRDQLLGRPVKEKDWMVVGATPEDLLQQGYKPVGKHFPVFLHPQTKEEYALARTERKTAPGYAGFVFNSSPTVSLEEDLARRDLTINAIAEDAGGQLIDPYHGQQDLQAKVLRHVSPAFCEDPVRMLRVARFAASLTYLGFRVAKETNALMQTMVNKGEVKALVAERVWQEWYKAWAEKDPAIFFKVLHYCGALAVLFPEIAMHYESAVATLIKVANVTQRVKLRFAATLQVLSLEQIEQVCQRFHVPNDLRRLGLLAKRHLSSLRVVKTAEQYLYLLEQLDAFRRPQYLTNLLALASALDYEKKSLKTVAQAFAVSKQVNAKKYLQQGISGKALGRAIHDERLQRLKIVLLQLNRS